MGGERVKVNLILFLRRSGCCLFSGELVGLLVERGTRRRKDSRNRWEQICSFQAGRGGIKKARSDWLACVCVWGNQGAKIVNGTG